MNPYYKTLLVSSVCMAAAYATSAYADTKAYYTGQMTCGNSDRNPWIHEIVVDGNKATLYRAERVDQATWYEYVYHVDGTRKTLTDERGNIYLEMVPSGDGYEARWINGKPAGPDCVTFMVHEVEPTRDRFDTIIAQLETENPTTEDAITVQNALKTFPIAHALPKLDQQEYFNRYKRSYDAFWAKYVEELTREVTSADIDVLKTSLAKALSEPLQISGWLDKNGMQNVVTIASERLAVAGHKHPIFAVSDYALMCERFSLLRRTRNTYYDFSDLQFIVGQSFDFWDRNTAETVIKAAEHCNHTRYVSDLSSQWSKIVANQEIVASYRAERNRLLALPATIQTLKETRNLGYERDNLTRYDYDLVKRYLIDPLNMRRTEIVSAAFAEIEPLLDTYTLANVDLATKVNETCYVNVDQFDDKFRTSYRETCTAMRAKLTQVQVVEGKKRVEAIFAAAEPSQPSAEEAKQVCENLEKWGLTLDAGREVYLLCEAKRTSLEETEQNLKCENAVKASGGSDGVLSKTIFVKGDLPKESRVLRDVVCEMGRANVQIKFESSGMLMWAKTHLSITPPNDEGVIIMELAEMKGENPVADYIGTKWVQVVEGVNIPEAEGMIGCMVGTTSCWKD